MIIPVRMTQEGIGIFLRNLASFGGWFGLAIASTSRVTFVVVLALLLYGLWHFHQEKRDMCYLIALAGMLIGIVLPQLFLREPVFAARVLISCVVLAIFLGMLLSRAIQQKRAAALLLLPLLLSGFAGAYAYGNVLHAQSDCNRRVAQQIVSDIGQMDPGAARNDIVIFGQAPSAREREHAKAKRPIIVAMTPIYMNGDWMWGGILMNHLSARDFHVIKAQEDDQAWMKAAQPCLTRDMYRIYLRDDCWIVDFAPEKRL